MWTIDSSNNLVERIANGVIVTDSAGAYSAFAGPDDLATLYALPNNTSSRTTVTASDGLIVPGDAGPTWTSPTASTTLTGTLAAWVITAVDCTAGTGARTLPAASSVAAGTPVCAKKADTSTNTLVVSRAGSDLIYGTGSGATSKTLSLAGEAVEFVSNGVDKWTVRSSDTPSGVLATTYAQLAGPLGRWKSKHASDPTNAKVVFVGDSTSDPTTGASTMFRRLHGLHTQAGESLYGVASTDYFADAVTTNASPTLTSATAAFTSADVGRMLHGRNIQNGTTISAVTNATTVTMTANATASGTSLPLWVGRHLIAGGNNGLTLSQWFSTPALNCRYNRNQLVTDNPDLIVYSWLFNDIRQGALGITEAACVTAGIALLDSLISWTRANLPNADILLRMPNTMLTADTSSNHFVTDGTNTNPTGQAQIYSTALRRIYLYFRGRYDHVDVIDIQGEVFGTACAATHPFMVDQLHPSTSTTGDIQSLVPSGGGYAALADALAARIGSQRNPFVPAGVRVRGEFIVYDGPSANTLRLLARDVAGLPATQAPVFLADSLYIQGAGTSNPISLASAGIDRTFSTTVLSITSLTGDWSPYIGKTAVITGTHARETTGDRTQMSVDLASITAGTTATQNVTVTGVYRGDAGKGTGVIAVPGAGFNTAGLLLLGAYPTGTDTVKLVISNPTAGDVDVASESWTFWIVR